MSQTNNPTTKDFLKQAAGYYIVLVIVALIFEKTYTDYRLYVSCLIGALIGAAIHLLIGRYFMRKKV